MEKTAGKSTARSWNERYAGDTDQATFATFLASTAGIPPEEAEQIAAQVLREWNERQDTPQFKEEQREAKIGMPAFAAIIALALLGLLLGLALLVWLAIVLLL
jgi:hypothetical protein